jgi:hypothetical protein
MIVYVQVISELRFIEGDSNDYCFRVIGDLIKENYGSE